MKKSTHWVTIPEEKVHTPASSGKSAKRSGSAPVKNKVFWGAAFVVLVVFTFALLAPRQMANILQGNLFEGDSFQVVPEFEEQQQVGEEEPGLEEAMEAEVMEEKTMEEEAPPETVVEAQTEAVSIQVL